GGRAVVLVDQLQNFAFRDAVGGIRHDLHDLHVANAHHDLECTGIDEIAHQHAGGVVPLIIVGGAAATHGGHVDDVVMQQGCCVDKFDHRGQANRIGVAAAAGSGCQQYQYRTQALASRIDNVVSDAFD